ncbi:hypothetical protein, partial [Microcoleus sp. C2D2]|uniref:hypothetical protein n=1 Tax=Microcoleus sp. C2D2 TaxID=3055326 RepID=UPI002FD42CE6
PKINRQDACSTIHQVSCGVGILPAQNQQARCLFHNTSSFLWGGHLARPKKYNLDAGQLTNF